MPSKKKYDGEILKCDMKPAWYLKGPNGQEKTYWEGTHYILDVDAIPKMMPSPEACHVAMQNQSEQAGWKVIMRPEEI